jgi:hypothetical protein
MARFLNDFSVLDIFSKMFAFANFSIKIRKEKSNAIIKVQKQHFRAQHRKS